VLTLLGYLNAVFISGLGQQFTILVADPPSCGIGVYTVHSSSASLGHDHPNLGQEIERGSKCIAFRRAAFQLTLPVVSGGNHRVLTPSPWSLGATFIC
jgi:hypothetical protein